MKYEMQTYLNVFSTTKAWQINNVKRIHEGIDFLKR